MKGEIMKTLTITLITLCICSLSQASSTNLIKAETILFAGTTTDVLNYLEIELRREAIKACGSEFNVSGIMDYKIKINLLNSLDFLEIDFNKPDFTGELIGSNKYPKGEATAEVVCKNSHP